VRQVGWYLGVMAAVAIAGSAPAAGAAEAKPAATAKANEVAAVAAPFDQLAGAPYAEQMKVFKKLLARCNELAKPAAEEAARLRKLTAGGGKAPRGVASALAALAGEAESIKTWRAGAPKSAAPAAAVAMATDWPTLSPDSILEKASAAWGVNISLSPAGSFLLGGVDLDMRGTVTLSEFLNWLTTNAVVVDSVQLVVGHCGDRIVLMPKESAARAREETAETAEAAEPAKPAEAAAPPPRAPASTTAPAEPLAEPKGPPPGAPAGRVAAGPEARAPVASSAASSKSPPAPKTAPAASPAPVSDQMKAYLKSVDDF
jgi:hypothetical protein